MTKDEAMRLMYIIEKRRLSDVEATLIDKGDNRYIIRLDRNEVDADRCRVWFVVFPRDWARFVLEEVMAI